VYFVNWYGIEEGSFSTIRQLHLRDPSVVEVIYNGSSKEKQDSLFYDSHTHHLYWSDSKRDAILRCNIPCKDEPITILNITFEDNLGMLDYCTANWNKMYAYAVPVFYIDGDYIYWYNSTEQAIYKANKYNGTNPIIFATGIVGLNDFVIGHRPKTSAY